MSIDKKYLIDTPENIAFLEKIREDLWNFGHKYPAPGGSFPGMRAPVGWLRGHVGSMYSFLSAVAEGREASPSFEDGAHVQWVMEQAYKNDISAKDSTGGLSK